MIHQLPLKTALIDRIILEARKHLPKVIAREAVSRAVDYVYGRVGPDRARYFGAALGQLEKENQERETADRHRLAVDAVRVAVEARRDDELGENDRDDGLDNFLGLRPEGTEARH